MMIMDTLVKVKLVNKDAVLPSYAHDGDAGVDLMSMVDVTLNPGDQALIPTGVAIQLEKGYEAQIRPRSGLAAKNGISVTNSPGTVDAGFRSEIKVILINLGKNTYRVAKGDRIAQMVVNKLPAVEFVLVDELGETTRGEGGFGSTGK
jgi:dUTP pyrophosphatase